MSHSDDIVAWYLAKSSLTFFWVALRTRRCMSSLLGMATNTGGRSEPKLMGDAISRVLRFLMKLIRLVPIAATLWVRVAE